MRREMTLANRPENILLITRRLLIFAFISLLATGATFGVSLFYGRHLLASWLCFECGIIGGFVSIQQRLHKVVDEELELLSHSWYAILLIPLYGGIFALLLYVIFLSGLIKGHLFPEFYIPPFYDPPTELDVIRFLGDTVPKSGPDLAKLIFWCFLAGFSERLVPQIIARVSQSMQLPDNVQSLTSEIVSLALDDKEATDDPPQGHEGSQPESVAKARDYLGKDGH